MKYSSVILSVALLLSLGCNNEINNEEPQPQTDTPTTK